MEAGYRSIVRNFNAVMIAIFAIMSAADGADFRTQNFIVMAPSAALAKAVGDAAEGYRRDLSLHWLGRTLPPWPTPCPVRVIAGNLPAQGLTQYSRSPVGDFQMEVVGSPERILDSVLPHEVTHTILATHFGRPLPRWADEGICTTVEHESERDKHEAKLREFLRSRRGIAMNKLFLLTEYPDDILPMYAQGYSVCQFLIAQRGPTQFVAFLGDYMQEPSWTDNIRRHYGYDSLAELQEQWLAWVSVGNGPVDRFAKANLVNPSAPNAIPSPENVEVALASATGNAVLPTANPGSGSGNPATLLASSRDDARIPRFAPGSIGAGSTNSGDGWYNRPRRNPTPEPTGAPSAAAVASAAPIATATLTTTNAVAGTANSKLKSDPPSIYKVAQPQPEQGIGTGGTAFSSVGSSASVGNVPVQYQVPDRGTYLR